MIAKWGKSLSKEAYMSPTFQETYRFFTTENTFLSTIVRKLKIIPFVNASAKKNFF